MSSNSNDQKHFIPVAIPNLAGRELEYLTRCVQDNFVSSVGPFVTRFEEQCARALGTAGAVAASSGTCALHLALMAVGVRPGDLVALPSLTFIASANAVSHCHAAPWFFDVSPDSWTLDHRLLEAELARSCRRDQGELIHAETGKRVAAIMPVYTLGTPADMDAIGALAREYGLPVVADGAAALGARYKGRDLGGLADLTMVSFNGNKTVTAGGGGIVAGTDRETLDRIRHVSCQAKTGPGYRHDHVGWNYRMTNLQAAVGCAQMERLEDLVAAKREIRAFYDRAFSGSRSLAGFPEPEWADGACWFSGVLARDADMARRIRQGLAGEDIGTSEFWRPVHMQEPYKGSPATRMPVSESVWKRMVILPCSTDLTREDQQRTADAVTRITG